jgi:membrane associated rhomboid family serine protease
MLFPLGDDNPVRRTPVVTWLLIGMNAAVFVAFNLQMREPQIQLWTLRWGYDVDHPFGKQLFTSMFMHGGWAHILGNMWVLWIVGDNVEDKVGKVGYLALYLLGGCAAALTYAAIALVGGADPGAMSLYGREHMPLVGASGAIAAIMGMYLVFFPEARIRLLAWFFVFVQIIPVRAKWFIGLTLALDLVTSVVAQGASSGGVATMAHVGGGAFGIVAALILKPMVGGGGEGDAWDVHTGFAKRMRAGAEPWQDARMPPGPRMAPEETDEISIRDVERSIAQLVRGGRVREAIDVYPAYVAMAREQPLPDDVQIEIAHELYRQWLPKEAIPAYLRYLDTHPNGDDVAEAKFRLGVLYARGLSRRDEASRWLREAEREHHDPRIRAAAAQMLAQLGG